jgi:excisionase family DNA binding protein
MNDFNIPNHTTLPAMPQSPSRVQRLLTPGEVAKWLGVSDRWVRDHATRRLPRIPAVHLGSLLRFRLVDVEEFIAAQLQKMEKNFRRLR